MPLLYSWSSFDVEWMRGTLICDIVEMPIPDHDPIGNLQSTIILFTWDLSFNQAGTNRTMTHVLVLSAKVKRNERLK